MATDLALKNQADGHPDLARKALSLLTSKTDAIIAELGDDAPSAIAAAIAKTQSEMAPVPEGGPLRVEWEAAFHERFRRLAVKVMPTASPQQTKPWQDAISEALSDLPAMIVLTAAKKAIHKTFAFAPEVEIEVRRIAEEMVARRETRMLALRRIADEIERAANPAPALPANDWKPDAPWDADRICKMAGSAFWDTLKRNGLEAGAFTQTDLDAALNANQQAAA